MIEPPGRSEGRISESNVIHIGIFRPMLYRLPFGLFLLLSIAILTSGMGCGSDHTPSAIPSAADSGISDMMKRVYAGLPNFGYADVLQIQSSPNWNQYYDLSQESWGLLGTYGIDLSNVEEMTIATYMTTLWTTPPLVVLKGKFDVESLRTLLRSEDYDRQQYESIEIWQTNIGGYEEAVAIDDMYVLIGSKDAVENSVAASFGNLPSLYDDPDYREVIEQLPRGFSLAAAPGAFLGHYSYEDLLVTGLSLTEKGSNTLRICWVIKFSTISSARAAVSDMRKRVTKYLSLDPETTESSQEGEFVRIEVTMPFTQYFTRKIGEDSQ